eukprot:CAMPEP_0203922778 /NCGR_PEP_ID=MMETSP0359-20131031/62772_1 /ASSEMBLY_ACC=CAM_ASM_000338 /TAXON_ID=268821 /ORGANISM="Scrippsiella Hangoei, Strain SHTV-5" /LENGTH=113 /DNA_ID=CAMNT_0050850735 /DNA_START=195 /DNA_END=536 /DNA_ORIENTATION=-
MHNSSSNSTTASHIILSNEATAERWPCIDLSLTSRLALDVTLASMQIREIISIRTIINSFAKYHLLLGGSTCEKQMAKTSENAALVQNETRISRCMKPRHTLPKIPTVLAQVW